MEIKQLTEWRESDGFWFCLVRFIQTIGNTTMPAMGVLRMENGIIVNAVELQ